MVRFNTRVEVINGVMIKALLSLGLCVLPCCIFPSFIGFFSAQWEIRPGF